jgi:hypothetical protein
VNERDGGGGGLDARYEALRHAALHARAEAFPLGFAVLTRRGVTGWRRALTEVTANQATPVMAASPAPASLPVAVSAELVDALATVALAGTRTDCGGVIRRRNPLHHSLVRRERSPYRCSPTPPHPR